MSHRAWLWPVLAALTGCPGQPWPLVGRERPCQTPEIAITTDLTFMMGGDPACRAPDPAEEPSCANSTADSSRTSDTADRTIPEHMVRLDPYFMDQTEVTNHQYRECVDEGVCKPPVDCVGWAPWLSLVIGCRYERPENDRLPVVAVTWDDARKYCEWRDKRLPTEAEWERAAVGPRPANAPARTFPWGDEEPNDSRAYLVDDSKCRNPFLEEPAMVDLSARVAGMSAEGILELAGNVREWTADDFDQDAYCEPGSQGNGNVRPQRPNECADTNVKGCIPLPQFQSGVVDNPVVDRGRDIKVVRGGAMCAVADTSRVGHYCDITTRARTGIKRDFSMKHDDALELPGIGDVSSLPFASGLFNDPQITGFRCARSASAPTPPQDNQCPVIDGRAGVYTPPTGSSSSGGSSSSSG